MEAVAWFGVFLLAPLADAVSKKKQLLADAAAVSKKKKKTVFGAERAIDIDDRVFPTDKDMTELERGMEDCEHGWMKSSFDNPTELHYRQWLPPTKKTKPKGIVIWLHGIAAHSGRALVLGERKLGMALQCEAWIKEGYALYALDYYGHGYSEGVRFFVPSFEVNRDDIINFAKFVASEHDEGTPLFLAGESYGGCLTLHVAKHFQDNINKDTPKGFDSIILQAPAIIPPDLPPKPVVSFLTNLASYYPTWIPFFMPNPVSTTRIWRDKQVFDIFDSPERRAMNIEGGGKPFRLGTAVGMLQAMELVRNDIIPNLTVPFCVLHGQEDVAVPISGTELLVEKAQTPQNDQVVKRIPHAYHDLMADPTAEETMEFMIQYANRRVSQQQQQQQQAAASK